MKVVILAGGLGSRLSEETGLRPKPMIEIGGYPILWHIMKIYSSYGMNEFIICCGYMSTFIKRYFAEYFMINSDITVDLTSGDISYLKRQPEPWKIHLVDTGLETMTGGRLKRVAKYLDDEPFAFTYGDGLADIDIGKLRDFHLSHNQLATVTAVPSPGRFGILKLGEGDDVQSFQEKPANEMGLINGGFFILEPGVMDYIEEDATIWEQEPLRNLAKDSQLNAFKHTGFWQPMDTLREKRLLETLWADGEAPWKVW